MLVNAIVIEDALGGLSCEGVPDGGESKGEKKVRVERAPTSMLGMRGLCQRNNWVLEEESHSVHCE